MNGRAPEPPVGHRRPVLRAKISVPRLSSRYVARPRLLKALDDAPTGSVVLVSAPAGFGKSLLLADWASRRPDRTAWVNLDGDGGDDRAFWSALLGALTSAPAVPGDSPLHRLDVGAAPSRDPGFVAAVVNALEALPAPLALVLDDVQVLRGDPLHGLAALVRDRPATLRLVLSSRLDPPVRLHRLRLDAHLVEVRAADLAFTPDEARTLLAGAEVAVSAEQLGVLLAETGGWPAGLRLVALALRDAEDPAPLISDLVRTERAVADYLVDEILSRLPADVLDVLTMVSLCEEVTAPLAVVLSGRENAGDVLAALEDETSLVTSYGAGRRWFRVHPLLRAQVGADLLRRRPGVATAVHGRAARWLAAAGELDGALDHAVRAGDATLLAGLLHEFGAKLATSGYHDVVCRALDGLPAGWSQRDPALALVAALAHHESGQVGMVARLLADADAAWPAEPGAALTASRQLARSRHAWFAVPEPAGVAATPGDATGSDAVSLVLRSHTATARDEPREAAVLARAALDRAVDDGNPYMVARATSALAVAHAALGDIATMLALARRAEDVAPAHGWRGTIGQAYVHQQLAYGALLQARPADALAAVEALDEAVEERGTRREFRRTFPVVEILRHAARFDLGEQRTALRAMRHLREGLPHGGLLDRSTYAVAALLEHGAALRSGQRDDARDVLRWAEARLGPTGDVVFLRACGPAAISRYDVARQHLRPVLDGTVTAQVPWVPLAGWVLEAAALLRTGRRPPARRALAEALASAAATGVLRPLVAAPDDVAELLGNHRGEHDRLAREVLALRRAWRRHEPPPPLTERERDVLDLLPTMLSLDEIAEALAVSVNTVKTHTRTVYAKLGASTRQEAVDVARGAGLLAADSRS